jgi:DNA-binding Lrp family transcriptional regulator
MKRKDLLILTELRKNARETLTNMSKRTKIPISTIYERIKNNNGGVITKFTSLVDFNRLGFSTRANIMLRVHKSSKTEIVKCLKKHHNTNSLYKINNGYDLLIEGVFRHLKELEEFLDMLDEKFELQEKQVHYIIDDIKRETFLEDPQLIPMIDEPA